MCVSSSGTGHRNFPTAVFRWTGFILIACCSLCLAPAHGFESFPEFESLTEEEEASFEGPAQLGSEYQSDVLTYRKPEAWNYEFLAHSKAFDLSTGSLDATHFLVDDRLKIQAHLNEWVEFRFTYFDDRDFEKQSVHHVLEMIAWPKNWLGLSVYGEPDYFKRKDDTGLAILLKPSLRHEVRLFNTFVDVTLLKRNDRSDTFLTPDLPYSRGVVGRAWSSPEAGKKEFLEYAARYDTNTRWYFPDAQYIYGYHKWFASIFFSQELTQKVRLNARFQFDEKYEARDPTALTSTIAPQHWVTDRAFMTVRAVLSDIGPRRDWELTLGMEAAYRWWKTDLGVAEYRDWLPHLALALPGFASPGRSDRWSIGLISTIHHSEGPSQLFSQNEKPSVNEFRFNLTYEFNFSERASLRLLATGDLDEYGSPASWEGGNAQMILYF